MSELIVIIHHRSRCRNLDDMKIFLRDLECVMQSADECAASAVVQAKLQHEDE
jgi:hypothetical protein